MDSLHIAGNSLPVTIVTLTSTDPSSEIRLYNLVAGNLTQHLVHSDEHWTVSTTVLNNDALHEKIQESCRKHLKSDLSFDDSEIEHFESNAPHYLVTERITVGDDKLTYAECTRDEDFEVDERRAYKYSNSNNKDIFFRIFEPASPADMCAAVPGQSFMTQQEMVS